MDSLKGLQHFSIWLSFQLCKRTIVCILQCYWFIKKKINVLCSPKMFWSVNSFPSGPIQYFRFFSFFKEKDDNGSGSHGSWLDLSVDNRTCEWCSAPYDMRSQLPNYVKVPLDDWHKDLLLDLCYCFDCVQEYHRLQDELGDDSRKVFVLLLYCTYSTLYIDLEYFCCTEWFK